MISTLATILVLALPQGPITASEDPGPQTRTWAGPLALWPAREDPPPSLQANLGADAPIAGPGRVTGVQLEDQFGKKHTLSFPRPRGLLLTIADRNGADQLDEWLKGLRAPLTNRVDLAGIADVRGVPKPFRRPIVRGFQERYAHPVLLDWSGRLCRDLLSSPGQANVILVDAEGWIRRRWVGQATPEAMQSLLAELERMRPGSGRQEP